MKEIISRYVWSVPAGQIDRAIQRQGKRRQLRRRIKQPRATDGAAIADRIMPAKHACQQRYLTVNISVPFHAGHRANAHNAFSTPQPRRSSMPFISMSRSGCVTR